MKDKYELNSGFLKNLVRLNLEVKDKLKAQLGCEH